MDRRGHYTVENTEKTGIFGTVDFVKNHYINPSTLNHEGDPSGPVPSGSTFFPVTVLQHSLCIHFQTVAFPGGLVKPFRYLYILVVAILMSLSLIVITVTLSERKKNLDTGLPLT
ncbi:MAG TPA: hypothetical protein P5293_05690 [Bacteroidales bacterium]|nr:hypothetical protein [Bacteroidales bacterium]